MIMEIYLNVYIFTLCGDSVAILAQAIFLKAVWLESD